MAADIEIHPYNANFVKLKVSSAEVDRIIDTNFTYTTKGYAHNPLYKQGLWDGKTSLYGKKNRTFPKALVYQLIELAKQQILTYADHTLPTIEVVSRDQIKEITSGYGLPFEIDAPQLEAIYQAINNRVLIISPTGSGKTAIMYCVMRYYSEHGKRVLVILPEKYHVTQLRKNILDKFKFDDAGWIFNGYSKWKHTDSVKDCRMLAITQQSIWRKDSSWFEQFDVIIGDEAHKFSAKSYQEMVSKWANIENRFGCTGSLSHHNLDDNLVRSVFGRDIVVSTASQLITAGRMAKPTIQAIRLTYPQDIIDTISQMKVLDYKFEINFLTNYLPRNQFIAKLATELKGNILVIFKYKSHGEELFNLIKQSTRVPTFFIDGDVDVDERERFIDQIVTLQDSISVFSSGTSSTGVDIPNVSSLIKAHPSKSRVQVLQTDGRALRVTETKNTTNVFDVYDQLRMPNPNHTLRHFKERLKIYREQKYDVVNHTYKITG